MQKKKFNSLTSHVRWCEIRHFTLNLTHTHEFYQNELDTK